MISASIHLFDDTELSSRTFGGETRPAIGSVHVSERGGGWGSITGPPLKLRELAAVVERAARQAEELDRIEGLLRQGGEAR